MGHVHTIPGEPYELSLTLLRLPALFLLPSLFSALLLQGLPKWTILLAVVAVLPIGLLLFLVGVLRLSVWVVVGGGLCFGARNARGTTGQSKLTEQNEDVSHGENFFSRW